MKSQPVSPDSLQDVLVPSDEGRPGTILGVWAHPDDEAYLSAGLMARAISDGARVVVVTATRGERGAPDPVEWSPERMGRLRQRELAASLAALGVTEHLFLGHLDGTCAGVGLDEGARQIAGVLEDVDPDLIVTFGPDGMTGHPDHSAVSAWTSEALQVTGSAARLLHATTSRDFLQRHADIHERFGIFFGGEPPWTPPEELALELELDQELMDAKLAALRAQASQTAPILDQIGEERFRQWWAVEWFADGRDRLDFGS